MGLLLLLELVLKGKTIFESAQKNLIQCAELYLQLLLLLLWAFMDDSNLQHEQKFNSIKSAI